MVRKGIPDSLRGDVWQILTGSRDEMAKSSDVYSVILIYLHIHLFFSFFDNSEYPFF
jgi:hypothetical protein